MVSVACVLRSGGEYTPEHVRALRAQVARCWPRGEPLRFVALSDLKLDLPGVEDRPLMSRWPGWWSKLELFSGAQDGLGDILYFDLDTIIVGSLAQVASINKLTMLADFYRTDRLQSGMMFLPAVARPEACAAWLEGPQEHMRRFKGDGQFLDYVWHTKATTWQQEIPGQVVSFKVHVRKLRRIPDAANVICFHGKPRPWETPLWKAL